MSRYLLKPVEAESYEAELDYPSFMLVFKYGTHAGKALMFIEPVGQPSKRVVFGENLPVSFQNVVPPKVS